MYGPKPVPFTFGRIGLGALNCAFGSSKTDENRTPAEGSFRYCQINKPQASGSSARAKRLKKLLPTYWFEIFRHFPGFTGISGY
jgi:hypothetical protein